MPEDDRGGRLIAEIDGGALARNVRRVAGVVGPAARVMAVVKANAYGHGAALAARAARDAGAAWLGVATAAEAAELRAAGIEGPICHLPPFAPGEGARLAALRITPVLSSIAQAREFAAAAEEQGLVADAHIGVDTGMGRSGVHVGDAGAFAAEAGRLPGLRFTGICTHFSSAESDAAFTLAQVARFEEAVSAARAAGAGPLVRHAANSAATLLYPSARFDMVRPGLLTYGIVPDMTAGSPEVPDFEPALTLRTQVLLVRAMPRGATVSYGRTHVLERDSVLGTLGAGYGDGYPRALSGIGYALVRGRRAPIVGRVCMDVTVVDLTGIPGAAAGDEAVLIGAQGGERIEVVEIARAVGTTEHDVTTRLTGRVERRTVRSAEPAR